MSAWLQRARSALELMVLIVVPSAVLGGCMFGETHYLRAVDGDGVAVNYYRIQVSGSTLFSSSRYLSGYFDDEALNTYFNEYTQSAGARLDSTNYPAAHDRSTAKLTALDGSSEGKSLVLILSSNSDAIAEGIGTLAQSNDIASILTGVVTKGRTEAKRKATAALHFGAARGRVLLAEGDQMVADLDATRHSEARKNLTRYAEELATFLSGDYPKFDTLSDVQKWLEQHQGLSEK